MKRQMLFFFLSITTPFYAADTKQQQETYDISLECAQNLKNIDTDYDQLSRFFSLAFWFSEEINPSILCEQLQNELKKTDTLPIHYASASTYINLISKHTNFFKTEFENKLSTEKEKHLKTIEEDDDEEDIEFAKEYVMSEARHSANIFFYELFENKLEAAVHDFKIDLLKKDVQDVIERKKTSQTTVPTVRINSQFQEVFKS
jgi:hypothetical protein